MLAKPMQGHVMPRLYKMCQNPISLAGENKLLIVLKPIRYHYFPCFFVFINDLVNLHVGVTPYIKSKYKKRSALTQQDNKQAAKQQQDHVYLL